MFSKAICVVLLAVAASASLCDYPVPVQSIGSCDDGAFFNGALNSDCSGAVQINAFPGSDCQGAYLDNSFSSSVLPTSSCATPEVPYAPIAQVPQPSTKVISNNCRCVKTVVRPQLVKQIIEVPTTRQYIQTFNKPVVQKIVYKTRPQVNSGVIGASSVYQPSVLATRGCSDYAVSGPAQFEGCGSYPSYPAQIESCGSYPSYPAQTETCGSYPSYPVQEQSCDSYPVYPSAEISSGYVAENCGSACPSC